MKRKMDDFTYFQLVYPKIIESVRLAASSPEIQLLAFSESVFVPDEIGDTIEHAAMMARALMKMGYITKEQFDSVEIIDRKFDEFTQADWSVDAMCRADNWEVTRSLAKEALERFSVAYAIPNIYWFITL